MAAFSFGSATLAWLGGAVTTGFSGFFVGFLCVQKPNIHQDPLVASVCVKCCRVQWNGKGSVVQMLRSTTAAPCVTTSKHRWVQGAGGLTHLVGLGLEATGLALVAGLGLTTHVPLPFTMT